MPATFPDGADLPRAVSAADTERLQHVLRQFLQAVIEVLDEVIGDSRLPERLASHDLADALRAAWEEMREDRTALPNLAWQIPADGLRRHGLEGRQLTFKLAAIEANHRPFRAAGDYTLPSLAGPFRRLLEHIDVLLESVLAAIPGAPIGLAEIKKYTEKLWT